MLKVFRILIQLFAGLLVCVSPVTSFAASPRVIVPMDEGWRFYEGAAPAASAAVFDDSKWDAVTTPHMFPPVGEGDHKGPYRGEGWYRKRFDAPEWWKGERIFLRFDAVAMVSDVYLNGELLGEHRGGFAAFTYEVTGKLKLGQANQISVRVDDRWNDGVAPLETSLLYGGIYRHVSLIVTAPVDISTMDYSSPGVYLKQSDVSAAAATVEVNTEINNGTDSAQHVTVSLTLMDANGKELFSNPVAGDVIATKTTEVTQSFTILKPHLWDGVADPYLYSVRVDLLEGDGVIDSVTQPLGLRSFHVDPKRGFILNGKVMQIHGVCLHQDWGGLGWAVGQDQEKQDLSILREMGADGIRLVHYQHSQPALDLYDKAGMIIWSELAQFRLVNASDAYRQNVRQQLTEMIKQNYNHPSIMMWSLYNELASSVKLQAEPIVKDLNVLAHHLDPTRPTVAAASGDTIANAHEIVASQDLIGDNNYAGWYSGVPSDMNKEIEKWNAAYGDRGLAISEYGAGAKISDHKQNLVVGNVKPYDMFQPEEMQSLVHEGNYRAIRSHPVVWGSFVWLAFDSGGMMKSDGTIQGGNIKGLVTQDRKVKKDAYFLYQANWTTKPMLYITSRRDVNRTDSSTPVKVYSNEPSVALTVNGKSYGEQKPDDLHAFHWQDIALEQGENHVVATGSDGLKDEVVWILK